jgi:hypothetical protein
LGIGGVTAKKSTEDCSDERAGFHLPLLSELVWGQSPDSRKDVVGRRVGLNQIEQIHSAAH